MESIIPLTGRRPSSSSFNIAIPLDFPNCRESFSPSCPGVSTGSVQLQLELELTRTTVLPRLGLSCHDVSIPSRAAIR
jgi:hypothetical protein